MKRRKWLWGFSSTALFVLLALSLSWAGNDWDNISKEMRNARVVLIDPDDTNLIYLGTDKGLFKSYDAGESWKNLFLTKVKNISVNYIFLKPEDKNIFYVATEEGLFYSEDKGARWSRIFKGKDSLEANCSSVVAFKESIFLGTNQGLFISKDRGRSWHKQEGRLGRAVIFNILSFYKNPALLYISSSDGVFKSMDYGKNWERVFISTFKGSEEEEDDNGLEDIDEEAGYSDIRYLAICLNNPAKLFLATSTGIYQSSDGGLNWEKFSDFGLLSYDVSFLFCAEEFRIYCATKSGVFVYAKDRWEELSLGLSFKKVNFLASDKNNNLYACLDSGLFRLSLKEPSEKKDITEDYFNNEPTIAEVQREAIKYAEVSPEKISSWRRQAAKKAWLPKLTLKSDIDRNKTISKSIWGTSGTGTYDGKHYVGPDDETRYNNFNWNVSLAWDFGDLIWNSAQTSIDVRSRLMVQLRDSILDEVNKIYFERIRVKAEIDNLSIEDRKKRFEKELKLKELTASLDGLTGGLFSAQLGKK